MTEQVLAVRLTPVAMQLDLLCACAAYAPAYALSWWTGLPRNQLDLPPGEGYERE